MAIEARSGIWVADTSTGSDAQTYSSAMSQAAQLLLFFLTGATADGFKTDLGLGFGAHVVGGNTAATFAFSDDAQSTTKSSRYNRTDAMVFGAGYNGTSHSEFFDATYTSGDASGFTPNINVTSGNAYRIPYLALTGFANIGLQTFTSATSATTKDVTGFGFDPTWYIIFGGAVPTSANRDQTDMVFTVGWFDGTNSFAFGISSDNAEATTSCHRGQRTDRVLLIPFGGSVFEDASHDSFITDGVRLSFSNANVNPLYYNMIAGTGSVVHAGSHTSPGSTGNDAITGSPFAPVAGLLATWMRAASTSVQSDARGGVGSFSSEDGEAFIGATDDDGTGTSVADTSLESDEAIQMLQLGGSIDEEANLASVDAEGITLNWTTADATARQFGYLFFGEAAAGGVSGAVMRRRYMMQGGSL